MAKKKTEPAPGLSPIQTDETASPNGKQAAPADAGLVLTAAPQTPAATEAREALLKAIASEATAITNAKDKTQSATAVEALARAYALVTTSNTQITTAAPAQADLGTRNVPYGTPNRLALNDK
ncbi:hypothetical protein ACWDYJ_26595 [Streptomyces sp. NPDC003042]